MIINCRCFIVCVAWQAGEEKTKALSAAALQISEQEARICHLEQQAATDKEVWLSEQDKLSSTVTKLEEDLKERDIHSSSLGDQLHQVLSSYSVYLSVFATLNFLTGISFRKVAIVEATSTFFQFRHYF